MSEELTHLNADKIVQKLFTILDMGPFIKDVIHRGGGFLKKKLGQKGRHPNYIIFGENFGKITYFRTKTLKKDTSYFVLQHTELFLEF